MLVPNSAGWSTKLKLQMRLTARVPVQQSPGGEHLTGIPTSPVDLTGFSRQWEWEGYGYVNVIVSKLPM